MKIVFLSVISIIRRCRCRRLSSASTVGVGARGFPAFAANIWPLVYVGLLSFRLIGGEPTDRLVISTGLIDALVAEARTNNPALQAAYSRANAASLNADAVRSWEDPTAAFGGSVYSDKGFRPSEDGNLAYGVEQKLPLWGRPKLTRQAAESEVSMRQAESALRLQELRRDITQALLSAALAEQVVLLAEEDLTWLDAAEKSTQAKYRAGDAPLTDTLQIQNERAERNDALITDHHRLAHERFALNRLLGRTAESPWNPLSLPPVGPAIPLSQKLLSISIQSEPKLRVMEQEIKQAQAAAELTKNSRLPDVSFGVEGRQYTGDGDFRSGMFTVRFSLPWFNESKYHKDYRRDKERQRSAELEREDQIWMVREELHHLSVEIEAARREALLYRDEIAPRSGQILANRLAEWEAGRRLLRDVLDARQSLLESQLMSVRAVAEQNRLLAELLRWTGLENLEALAPLANEPAFIPDHSSHTL